MKRLLLSAALAICCNAQFAHSAETTLPYPADLPPLDQALSAIRQAPQTQAAQAMIEAGAANRDSLEAGPHEWAIRVESTQRNVNSTQGNAAQRFNEWRGMLERPLRLPGKAAIDARIGAEGVTQAKAAFGDAMHETARGLLKGWLGWLREREAARQWQLQAESLAKQQQATARRVQLGDAPRLELMQSEAATAQAQAAHEQAKLRTAVAAADLHARYPALTLPETITLSTPQPLEGSLAQWREHLLEHNHELMLARSESQRARLMANRVDAERMPDPSIGVHVGSERGGEERLTGVSLSIPLPGQARAANARRETAMASAAAQREAATTARINAEIAGSFAAAQASYESWRLAEDAAQRIEQAATLTARARTLGEAGLGDVLLAQRQANEARLLATSARLDALEARYRLYVDAHQLWPSPDEDHTDGN
jgi:outer membrane protein, heavy metal efflux system